ncbi:MAG: hypothetical protein F6J89_07365 [Symploca sp. SIO1C4]|uniref:Uncharacterized protein n=1 Tax=Symploca sp. SIO1C4 TaxID=2607765 RepID=A0A6B3N981_9CYAN|nr:hypothetical protein [Symploca sp. SIO1C4]
MSAIDRLKMTGLFALMGFCCSNWGLFYVIGPFYITLSDLTILFFRGLFGALIPGLAAGLILTVFRKYYVTNKRLIITGLFALMGFCGGSQFPFALVYDITPLFFTGLLQALLLGLASWLIITLLRNSEWSDKRLVMIGQFIMVVGFCAGSILPAALTIGSIPVFVGGIFVTLVLGLAIWLNLETSKRIKYWVCSALCLVVTPYLLIFNSPQSLDDCVSVGNIFLGGLECYYRPNPTIDTVLPPEFSEEKFFSIKPGMDRNEVIALLGKPTQPELGLHYGDDGAAGWWDFAYIDYRIFVDDNDKVIGTYRDIHYN